MQLMWKDLSAGDQFIVQNEVFMVDDISPYSYITLSNVTTGESLGTGNPPSWTDMVVLAVSDGITEDLAMVAIRTMLGGITFGEIQESELGKPFAERSWNCPAWEAMDGVTRAAHLRVFHGGSHDHAAAATTPHAHQ